MVTAMCAICLLLRGTERCPGCWREQEKTSLCFSLCLIPVSKHRLEKGKMGSLIPSKRIARGTALSSDHPCHICWGGAGGEWSGIITMNKGWVSTAVVICDLGLMLFQTSFSEVEPRDSPTYLEPSPLLMCNQLLPPNLRKHRHLHIFHLSAQACVPMSSWDGAGRETHIYIQSPLFLQN